MRRAPPSGPEGVGCLGVQPGWGESSMWDGAGRVWVEEPWDSLSV